jgi:hypothetical protein
LETIEFYITYTVDYPIEKSMGDIGENIPRTI